MGFPGIQPCQHHQYRCFTVMVTPFQRGFRLRPGTSACFHHYCDLSLGPFGIACLKIHTQVAVCATGSDGQSGSNHREDHFLRNPRFGIDIACDHISTQFRGNHHARQLRRFTLRVAGNDSNRRAQRPCMPHRAPNPRCFSANGHRQHHIVFAKGDGLQVGNATLIASFSLACCNGNDRSFTRSIFIRYLLRDTARRPCANND